MTDDENAMEAAAEKYRKSIEDRTWTMATHEHAERDFATGWRACLSGPLVTQMREGAKELLAKLTQLDSSEEFRGLFAFYEQQFGRYSGPNCVEEVKALEAALAALDAAKAKREGE